MAAEMSGRKESCHHDSDTRTMMPYLCSRNNGSVVGATDGTDDLQRAIIEL